MKRKLGLIILPILVVLTSFIVYQNIGSKQEKVTQNDPNYKIDESRILSYAINPKKQKLDFYWKDKAGKHYENFEVLKKALQKEGKELVFAMNGGMFRRDLSPQGLFIQNGKIKAKIDTVEKGYGNFYMQPNGIFYLTNNDSSVVCTTKEFLKANNYENIKYATQSGPMLLIDGKMHSKFMKGSSNLNIRNGVGVLPNGNLLFAMSKKEINFYDFATFFKQNDCKNALYLDGFVSKTYLPSKNWQQTDGIFGVIIAETK
ncbi:phosphodiester glycosidase family protein [Bernardetia sp.]|uniref:phosphodiester glycosidase family protein n=1 Tax=Bernardetia sp. TaxID=1937974 RepID=UPI0025B99B59|nr:phosphodiester glycosidase family protein [Bernardetia sp.]